MALKRKATAQWKGTGKEGSGTLTTTSKVLKNTPYSWMTRFQNENGEEGTNPEELIAAAHGGCFTMALSFQLAGAGFTPTELTTKASVVIEPVDGKNTITGIHLEVRGEAPGISQAQFEELAEAAKKGCPVSRALAAVPITIDAALS
jgi:osmotically inducible protein OsmC